MGVLDGSEGKKLDVEPGGFRAAPYSGFGIR
jgi:hypothetical protein